MSGFEIVGEIISFVLVAAFGGCVCFSIYALPAKWIYETIRFDTFRCFNSFHYLGFINKERYHKEIVKNILKILISIFAYVCAFIIFFCDFDIYGQFKDNALLCVCFICTFGGFVLLHFEYGYDNELVCKFIYDSACPFDDNYNQKTARPNTKDELILNIVKHFSPKSLSPQTTKEQDDLYF